MRIDRPAPGEELNETPEAPTKPRQAATVVVLRGGSETLEVLMVQRNPEQRFMGGAWVFPGGAVDAHEAEEAPGDLAHRRAAIRELAEEAGIELESPEDLVSFSRWVTPEAVKIRFDTRFFLAAAPEGAEAVVDGRECVDVRWLSPQAAIEAYGRGELNLVFPTLKTLEQLGVHTSADAALAAEDPDPDPITPRVLVEGDAARVVLPGEPGY
jgi:8-oxo-dGTP pyrophosphatase MutT (NUDIX family)